MSSAASSSSHLRLVGTDDPAARAAWDDRMAVSRENRAAAENTSLQPTDARWVLAARTASLLQGPVLTPDRRRQVLRTAKSLGVRPFDANVIIAIVQDGARRGAELQDAAPTLALVPAAGRSNVRTAWRWAAAIGTALVANALLIRWLLG